jgi:hypothetical protein
MTLREPRGDVRAQLGDHVVRDAVNIKRIYVNMSTHVGDAVHIKVLAIVTRRTISSRRTATPSCETLSCTRNARAHSLHQLLVVHPAPALFDRNRLRQVTWLVDVGTQNKRCVVRKKL